MILYFTGTGNSRYVAGKLSERLSETKVMRLDAEMLDLEHIYIDDSEAIIWVIPIYAWGLPPVIETYIKNVRLSGRPGVQHLVVTCGDDCGTVDRRWRRLMRQRRWKTGTIASVIMPNTYVTMRGFDVDPADVAEAKLNGVGERVEHIAGLIKSGKSVRDTRRGWFPRIKSGIIRPWFHVFAMSPAPFHPTDKCIGCGACARACPMNNISMHLSRPRVRQNCAFCLACYHHCPVHAMAYGNKTARKGQYICPEQ